MSPRASLCSTRRRRRSFLTSSASAFCSRRPPRRKAALGRALATAIDGRRRPDVQGRRARGDPQTRRGHRLDRTRPAASKTAIAELSRRARHRAGRYARERSRARFFDGPLIPAIGMAGDRRGAARRAARPISEQARGSPRSSAERRRSHRALSRDLLHGQVEPRKHIVTRAMRGCIRSSAERLCAEQDRVLRILERRKAVVCRDRTRGASHHRGCGARRATGREGPPRPARL